MSARAAWARAGLVLGAIVLADQALKELVTSAVQRGDSESVFFGIDLVNGRNSGVAFGMLEDQEGLVAVVIVIAMAALLAYFALNATRAWAWLPVGMLLGGAVGNAIDRLREGAVVDFIKLPYWPAFNLADMAITAGVFALLLVIERSDADRSPA